MKIKGLKWTPWLLALLMAGMFLLPAGQASATDEVKVGLVVPLTGKMAAFGQASLDGVNLYAEMINKAGGIKGLGGAKIKIVAADAGADPTTAASVTQRLLSRQKVVGVIGCFASSYTLAASEVTERHRVPLVTMSFTDKLTKRGFKYIFRVVPLGSAVGAAQLKGAVAIGEMAGHPIKNIAILYEDTAYGSTQAEGMAKAAPGMGVKVALMEAYPAGITDVTPIIQKVKLANPDIVFAVSYFTDSVLIIRSMRQAGLKMPVFGGAAGYVIPEFKEALGEYVNGIMSVNTSNYDHYGELGKLYRERHKKFMTHEAFEHAACLQALVVAMDNAKTADPKKLGAALHKVDITTGPAAGLPGGGIKFDASGQNVMVHPMVAQWQNGEMVSVWPPSYAKGKAHWPK